MGGAMSVFLWEAITSYRFSNFSYEKQLYILFCWYAAEVYMSRRVTVKLSTKWRHLVEGIASPRMYGAQPIDGIVDRPRASA
jgi:hypothetical protein